LSQASMLRLANASASSLRPTCITEEPQQPEPATFTTSMSWRVSRRTVASLTSGASTCLLQPGISATRLRRRPAAGKVCGRSTGDSPASRSGIASNIPLSRRSEEHTSELQSLAYLVCRLLPEKKKAEDEPGL